MNESQCSAAPSSQPFSGFIFGIALGSDLPAAVKDFHAYSNTANTNTSGQSVGTNLACAVTSSVLSTTATGTGGSTALSGLGGSSTFGVQTPLTGGSFFGSGASGTTGSTGGSFFGSVGGTGFGQTQNTGGFSFGAIATSNSGWLFGGTSQANTGTSSLFSTPAAGTGFGARPGGFTGFGTSDAQRGSSLFGTNTGATSSLFGQASATGAFSGVSASIAAVGTTVPFNPPNGQDTMIQSGINTNINTKHQCITAMKEYENKSLEELRMEYYGANRKLKQSGPTSTVGLFGQVPSWTRSAQANTAFGAGATSNSSWLFGGTSQANTGTSSLFSTPAAGTGFGARPGGFAASANDTNTKTCELSVGTNLTSAATSLTISSTTAATGFTLGHGVSTDFYRMTTSKISISEVERNRRRYVHASQNRRKARAEVGSTVPFKPPKGQDTMVTSKVTTNINTKHQCITAMKEYENKSLEELRIEDYSANRKSKQAGSNSTVTSRKHKKPTRQKKPQ